MTPWTWYAGMPHEDVYDIAEGATREAVIQSACRELATGETFRIIEARSSTALRYEGSDYVPFLRTRNEETLVVGPSLAAGRSS